MKINRKLLALIIAVAVVAALTFPALASDGETNGVVLIDQYSGEGYNQSFDQDAYHNTQGSIENPLPGVEAIPKDDAGHGHTWTIVVDDSVRAGTILTIAVQTQGNNYVAYVLRVDGPGEFQFPHDVSLGRGYVLLSSYTEPEPDPEPLTGMLEITKTFDGISNNDADREFTFIVEGPDGYEAEVVLPIDGIWYWSDDELEQGDYTVTEVIADDMGIGNYEFVKVTVNGDANNAVVLSLTEENGLLKRAAFVNFYDLREDPPEEPLTGSITVTKDVAGAFSKETVDMGYMFTVEGVDVEYFAEFSLPNEDGSWSWTDNGLKLGQYVVKEDTDSAKVAGYTLSVTSNGEVNVTLDEEQTDKTVDIVNNYSVVPPSQEDPVRTPRPSRDPDPIPEPEPIVEEVVNIIEEAPPLAAFEPEEEVLVEEEFVIIEEPVPMAEMPQTGIESSLGLWILALCAALLGAGALTAVIFKVKKSND